jgi:hypothetical protein
MGRVIFHGYVKEPEDFPPRLVTLVAHAHEAATARWSAARWSASCGGPRAGHGDATTVDHGVSRTCGDQRGLPGSHTTTKMG